VLAAAKYLNAQGSSTRVFGIPGSNFAAYDYGDTTDPVYPAILDRPYVAREQLPKGSSATVDLLYAIDNPIQVGTEQWAALAPVAQLMSAGDVLVQSDLNYARYDQPQPKLLWAELQPTPPGLGNAICFGKPVPNPPSVPDLDEQDLAEPNLANPCPLEVLPVSNPRALVRTEPSGAPLVIDGDAEGLVAAASVGLLAQNPTIFYAGTYDTHPGQLASALKSGSTVVVTDTNRKRAFRWDTIVDAAGQTLTASQSQPSDPNNSPIDLFPKAPASSESTADYVGVKSVTASGYGDKVSYLPEDRPFQALDGDLQTAWEVGAFGQPLGQWWQVTFDSPTTTDAVNLVQPIYGARNRWITKATLTFDGKDPLTVNLGPGSRTAAGQTITFPQRSFTTLRIRIDATNWKGFYPNAGPSSVGLAEVRVADVSAQELIDLPSDVLSSPAAASTANRLVLLLTRQRVSPYPPRQDPETAISRAFTLPVTRTFTLTGTARINALIPDDKIDQLTGREQASGIVAYSEGRLPGDLAAGAAAAIDGNPATVWSPGFGASSQAGSWIHLDLPSPVTFDHMDLQVVADGRHSLPTSITVATENGSRTVPLPPIHDGKTPGNVVTVPVTFAPLSGSHLQVTFSTVRLEFTRNYDSQELEALPLGIAELGIPGVSDPPAPAAIPTTCRDDVLTVDGAPVWLQMSGSSASALAGSGVSVTLCGPDAGGLVLGPGRHVVEAVNGATTGWNLDELAFDSAPGGGPEFDLAPTALVAPVSSGPAPAVSVISQNATTIHIALHGVKTSGQTYNLVLGESQNAGWKASVDGGPSLGPSELIDGFANGWVVSPAVLAGHVHDGVATVTLRWTPQRAVWVALVVSAVAFVATVIVAFAPALFWRRGASERRRERSKRRAETAIDRAEGRPSLAHGLLHREGRAPGWLVGAVTAGVLGGVLAAVTRPWIGLAVGLGAALCLWVRGMQSVLAWVGAGLAVASGVVVVFDQATQPSRSGFTWAGTFGTAAFLAWAAVACLAGDAVVEISRRVRARRSPPGSDQGSTGSVDAGVIGGTQSPSATDYP
jgi:arabinofuranan 3-O-arabinosyltransferase